MSTLFISISFLLLTASIAAAESKSQSPLGYEIAVSDRLNAQKKNIAIIVAGIGM